MRFATKYVKYAAFLFLILALVSCSRKKKKGTAGGPGSSDPSSVVLTSLTVDPKDRTIIAQGTTQQFTATGIFSDNSVQDLTAQATWSSSDESVATIDSSGRASGVGEGTTTIEATVTVASGPISSSTTLTVEILTLQSISILPKDPVTTIGTILQLKALGTFDNGSSQDLTQDVTWSSSASNIATIDSKGLAKGVAVGTTTITATFNGVSSSTILSVIAATLSSITVTPVNPSIVVGTTQQFTATGRYSNNTTQDITSSVTWSASKGGVTIDSAGLATGVTAGAVTITATSGSKSGSTFLTVNAAAITSIVVTSPSSSVTIGTTEQFTATGIFDNGTQQDITLLATWSSLDTSVATINATTGLATANGAGSTTITATFSGESGSKTLTVTPGTLTLITVTPATSSIAGGTTKQFAATGTYSSGITRPLTSSDISWSSSLSGFATIDSSTGLATAVSAGTTTIKATQTSNCSGESCVTGTASLTVTAATLSAISVTPLLPVIPTGGTRQFTATGIFDDGSSQDLTSLVTWSSSASSATITNTGLATGQGPGTPTIAATFAGKSGSTTLTVTSATLDSITISPRDDFSGIFMVAGTLLQFTATGIFSDGSTQDITDLATWTSSSPGTAFIDSTGLALGLAQGTTTIKALFNEKSDSTTLNVTTAVLESINVTPNNPSRPVGIPQQFTATGFFNDGSVQNLTASAVWTTSDAAIATIDSTGLAMPVSPDNNVTVQASFGGKIGTTTLNVNAAQLTSITLTHDNPFIGINTTEQFSATANFNNNTAFDITALATWSSTNSAVAIINNTGLATGIAVGTTTIKALFNGGEGLTPFEVKAIFLDTITVTPADSSIPVGGIQPFTATGTFIPGGSTQDMTTSVSWSSNAPGIATISNAEETKGFATGVALSGDTPVTITALFGTVLGSTTLTVGGANPTQVTAGKNHSCTRLTDGQIRCWGGNFLGQLGDNSTANSSIPRPLFDRLNTKAVAAGGAHTCALLTNGTVRCWGSNSSGQLGAGIPADQNPHTLPLQVNNLLSVAVISAGGAHTCVAQQSGVVKCWGENGSGQLGQGPGNTTDSTTPVQVPPSTNLGATAIATGANHSCALITGGSVLCWGENGSGQLGIGSTTDSLTPANVLSLANATAITTGDDHTCALLSDGKVKCWGENGSGQLGNGLTNDLTTPFEVPNLSNAISVAAGGSHTCAAVSTGEVKCWGANGSGQLGDNTTTNTPVPITVVGVTTAVSVTAGGTHSCVLLSGSDLQCWGENKSGQLGNGEDPISTTAVTVPGMELGTTIELGNAHTCARISDGTVKCMGDNQFGQLGDGTNTGTEIPVVVNVPTASSVAAGDFHSCAIISSDGSIRCWGGNNNGQLGDGTNTNSSLPVNVVGITNATAISGGAGYTCALISGGTVQCWGANFSGQLGNNDPEGNSSNTPVSVSLPSTTATAIAVGNAHACALLSDNTLMCWGENTNGQLGNGTTNSSPVPSLVNLSNIIAVAAGGDHTCAIILGGTVQCWGANGYGQLGNGTTATNLEDPFPNPIPVDSNFTSVVTHITAGDNHTCARTILTLLFCWGRNVYGQLGIGTTADADTPQPVTSVSDVTAIAAGESHTCARVSTSGGLIQCWGLGGSGQIGSNLILIHKTPVTVVGI